VTNLVVLRSNGTSVVTESRRKKILLIAYRLAIGHSKSSEPKQIDRLPMTSY